MGDPETTPFDPALGDTARPVSDRVAGYLEHTPAQRAEAISQLAALIAAAHGELLDLVTAADIADD